MSELPRYRCATDRGFFAQPTEITFAALGYRVGVGQRAELGDEFPFEGVPAKWMEPINEAARERVEELVSGGKRKSQRAEVAAVLEPIKAPPRSGMTRAIADANAFQAIKDVRHDERPAAVTMHDRPAPKRRAAAK